MKRVLAVLLLGIISLTSLTGFAWIEQQGSLFNYRITVPVFFYAD